MFTPSRHSTFVQRKNVAEYMDSVASYKKQNNAIPTGNGFKRPLIVGHNRRIHTPSANFVNKGFKLTAQEVSTIGCHQDSSMTEDGTMVCGDPVLFPRLNAIKNFHCREPQRDLPHCESPAKIFAKLKAKALKEMRQSDAVKIGKDFCIRASMKQSEFKSPKMRRQNTFTIEDIKENKGFLLDCNEAEAITLSPTHLPEKDLNFPYSEFSTKSNQLMSPRKDTGSAFKPSNRCTPLKQPFLKGLSGTPSPIRVQSRPITMVNAKKISHPPLPLFGDVSQTTNGTVFKGLPTCVNSHEDSCRKWVFEEPGILKDVPPLLKACVVLERLPSLQSPAKLFAKMKDRESKKELQVFSHTNCHTKDNWKQYQAFDQCRESATPNNIEAEEETCMDVSSSLTGSVVTPSHIAMSLDNDHNQPERDSSEGVPSINVRPYSDMVEDPLLLHASPRISIPKKRKAVFQSKQQAESTRSIQRMENNTEGINLMQWILKFNGTGLFVDGLRRDNNMAWHSNIIAERVSSTVVKTVSGSTYCLIGKMSSDLCSTLPSWLLKKFDFGFPQKWKSYLEEFLSESKGSKTESSKRNKERPASEKYSSLSTTQQTLTTEKRKPNQTPTHCLRPTAIPSQRGGPQVSRSGRVIKTPLEYWKGGRIILDCDMNVTIHESYNTSICESQISIPVTRRKSQKTKRPASVFLSPSEDFRLSKAGCKEDVSVPVRKIKVLHRHRQHSNPDDCKSSTNKAPISVESSNHSNNHTSPTCSSLEPTSHTSKQTYNIRSRDLTSPEMSLQRELPVVPIRSELRRGRSKVNRPAVVEQSDEEVQAGGYDSVQTASSSDDDFTYKRKPKGKMAAKTGGTWKCLRTIEDSQLLTSCDSSEGNGKSFRIKGNAQKSKTGKSTWAPQPRLPEVLPEGTQSKSSKTKESKKVSKAVLQDEEDIEDNWTEPELLRLHEAVTSYPKNMSSFWSNVAMAVGTRFAEECQQQYMSQKSSQTSTKAKKVKEAPQKKEQEPPSITAKVGTLKRKQQVRQLLDHMPKDDHDDIFNSSRMRNKRVQLPTVSPTGKEHVFLSSNPQTPGCLGYPTAKTPQCLHITPGMMGSVNRNDDDKYIYQLQKRMKKDQAKVHKHAPLSKKFTPSPSVKRAARRCTSTEENDSFVVWEMFPEVGAATVESGDEEDYYFTDD